ncbi:Tspear [Symbiodinium sp. CCMP2592]|nr:Tspear [Symbiodinium sp. CCMP2592]
MTLTTSTRTATGTSSSTGTRTSTETTSRTVTTSTRTATGTSSSTGTGTSTETTSRTMTTNTLTATSITSTQTTTTRTEPEGELIAFKFDFADTGVLSLAALGGFLLVLAVPIIMMQLLKENGRRQRSIGQGQMVGLATAGSENDANPQSESGTHVAHGDGERQAEPAFFADILKAMKRSPYVLAINMLLESGNLVTGLLYATEAYQRATLISFSVPCGSGILMPQKAAHCPTETDITDLPLCHEGLEVHTICEADVQVPNPKCHVDYQLDNCENYDIYMMEMPRCADVGCKALGNFMWVGALLSFFATVGWTALFFCRHLRKHRQQREAASLRPRFIALFVCLLGVLVATLSIGVIGGPTSVLAVALLCSTLPICSWSFAAWIASLPAEGEEVIVSQAAGLEIPFFNVLLAINLKDDNVQALNSLRTPLAMGLRIVEDAPELVIGMLDLFYFGGAWYVWLTIGMSMVMVVVQLSMGLFFKCLLLARGLAGNAQHYVSRKSGPMETE